MIIFLFNGVKNIRVVIPFTSHAASVPLFRDKKYVYLDAECLYNHIKQETFDMRTPLHIKVWMKLRECVSDLSCSAAAALKVIASKIN